MSSVMGHAVIIPRILVIYILERKLREKSCPDTENPNPGTAVTEFSLDPEAADCGAAYNSERNGKDNSRNHAYFY